MAETVRAGASSAGLSTPVTPPKGRQSPYFGTPVNGLTTPPPSAGPSTRRKRTSLQQDDQSAVGRPRRSRRLEAQTQQLPPTPDSLPPSTAVSRDPVISPLKGKGKSKAKAKAQVVLGPSEEGIVEPVRKIHLIQEKLRYEPWRMLVAVTLLNKTSGRAANPIREEIFARWPTAEALAQASITDLTEVLYPLGLFNQRANSLIRLSQQYVQLGWPAEPLPLSPTARQPDLPESLDVKVFYGAGVYASDSFRIYSPLFPGRGGPEQEDKWVDKRKRAIERRRIGRHANADGDAEPEPGVEEVGEWLSDDEVEEGEEEEWRAVRPTDKELRRYLVWRWGLEGIMYDIHRGPRIHRPRDKRRLAYLLSRDAANSEEPED